ncbi:MAG: hypothetical protein ACREFZ_00345 [Acetobacteraceae bacterium]
MLALARNVESRPHDAYRPREFPRFPTHALTATLPENRPRGKKIRALRLLFALFLAVLPINAELASGTLRYGMQDDPDALARARSPPRRSRDRTAPRQISA